MTKEDMVDKVSVMIYGQRIDKWLATRIVEFIDDNRRTDVHIWDDDVNEIDGQELARHTREWLEQQGEVNRINNEYLKEGETSSRIGYEVGKVLEFNDGVTINHPRGNITFNRPIRLRIEEP